MLFQVILRSIYNTALWFVDVTWQFLIAKGASLALQAILGDLTHTSTSRSHWPSQMSLCAQPLITRNVHLWHLCIENVSAFSHAVKQRNNVQYYSIRGRNVFFSHAWLFCLRDFSSNFFSEESCPVECINLMSRLFFFLLLCFLWSDYLSLHLQIAVYWCPTNLKGCIRFIHPSQSVGKLAHILQYLLMSFKLLF